MQTMACYSEHSHHYPSLLSYVRQQHYFGDSIRISPNSQPPDDGYHPGVGLSSPHLPQREQLPSADADENHQAFSVSSFDERTTTPPPIPSKRRSRLVPVEEKDCTYYEKRARNNDSAKRSRDTRRLKEQQIQDRVDLLQHENSRLALENQTIRYQLSQLHLLYNGIPKPLP